MEPLTTDDPRQVGVFRLHSRLGAGGMGRVYLGYSPGGRAVAVKIVHPELARDPEFMLRFRREVEAAEAVSGAYTAPVVGAGPGRQPAVARDGVRRRAVAGRPRRPGGAAARGRRLAAGRRPGRGAAGDPRARPGSPRPQAGQHPHRRRRAAGDRLRDLPGAAGRRHGADGRPHDHGHARVHVTRAGRGPEDRAVERRLLARQRDRVRRDGDRPVRRGQRVLDRLPGGARRAGPERRAAQAARPGRRLPGEGPGGPAVARPAHGRRRRRIVVVAGSGAGKVLAGSGGRAGGGAGGPAAVPVPGSGETTAPGAGGRGGGRTHTVRPAYSPAYGSAYAAGTPGSPVTPVTPGSRYAGHAGAAGDRAGPGQGCRRGAPAAGCSLPEAPAWWPPRSGARSRWPSRLATAGPRTWPGTRRRQPLRALRARAGIGRRVGFHLAAIPPAARRRRRR